MRERKLCYVGMRIHEEECYGCGGYYRNYYGGMLSWGSQKGDQL